ncbi:MAG: hypothetical protein KDC71_11670 [Acidobacteria bacterium]|nr:hypothetical protein [Acidobacteriota bacterium]
MNNILIIGAKFDGISSSELIDRKLNPVFSPKAVYQATRQAAVGKRYKIPVIWELPSQNAVYAANRFLTALNIPWIKTRLPK